jgi:hypothetical protein
VTTTTGVLYADSRPISSTVAASWSKSRMVGLRNSVCPRFRPTPLKL